MSFADAPDRRHGELDGRRRHRAEKDGAALAALEVGDLAVDLAHLEQHRAGAARQRLAGRRQRDAARQAFAELDAEDVLHLGDHARRGRLRDVEDLRGGADLGMVVERHDHAHVAELQPAAQHARRCRSPARSAGRSRSCPPPSSSRPAVQRAGSAAKIYQYCHIRCWKTHLTVISIPFQRPPVTSVGRRAAVPCARSEVNAGGSWGELSDTEGDCRFRDAGACARARDPGTEFIKRERVK